MEQAGYAQSRQAFPGVLIDVESRIGFHKEASDPVIADSKAIAAAGKMEGGSGAQRDVGGLAVCAQKSVIGVDSHLCAVQNSQRGDTACQLKDGMVCASGADMNRTGKFRVHGFGNFAAHAADRTKGISAVGQAGSAAAVVNRLGTGIVHIFMDYGDTGNGIRHPDDTIIIGTMNIQISQSD